MSDQRNDPHQLSGAYALDAVTAEEAAEMERAMAASEDLRSEVAELTDTAVLLGLAVPSAEPPPALRSRLLAAIETTPQLPRRLPPPQQEPVDQSPAAEVPDPRAQEAQRRWFARPGVLLAAIAAAAALLFGAGVLVDGVLRTGSSPSASPTFSQIQAAADVRHRTARVAGGGEVALYWSQQLGASAVVVTGRSAPTGKALQLWRMEGGSAKSAGLYRATDGGRSQVLKGAMHKGQVFGITVEPEGGSPKPTTAPIVAIPIT